MEFAATLTTTWAPSPPPTTSASSHFLDSSDAQALTAPPAGAAAPALTVTSPPPPCDMSTTARDPSRFLKAAMRTPEPPVVPMRTAPGRTKRDQLARAQRREETS